MLTDEGMIRAACIMRETINQFTIVAQGLSQERNIQRFEELIQRFENAVERFILDAPPLRN